MISAPNRQLPLSGNRFIYTILTISLLLPLSGCDMLKRVPKEEKGEKYGGLDPIEGRRVFNKKTGEWEYDTIVKGPMDTIIWTQVEVADSILISSEETRRNLDKKIWAGAKKTDYKIAFLLPFLTNRYNPLAIQIDPRALLFLHFYEGAKMAIDSFMQLESEINLDVYAIDTKGSFSEVDKILENPELTEMDVIIGPYRSSNIAKVATFTGTHEKILISPFSTEENLVSENPYFLQTTPSLNAHSKAIMTDISQKYAAKKVVVVVRNKAEEIDRIELFRKAAALADSFQLADSLRVFIVPEQDEDFSAELEPDEVDLLSTYIEQGDTTVFILPSWSNESFVYSFLRKLHIVRGENEVVVYGMPQWQDFDLVSYDYYEKLNVRISSANFINQENPAVKSFNKLFLEKYGELPKTEAYLGHDVTLFTLQALKNYGYTFHKMVDQLQFNGLHNNFEFSRMPLDNADVEMKADRYKYLENEHVHILEFRDYQFQKSEQ